MTLVHIQTVLVKPSVTYVQKDISVKTKHTSQSNVLRGITVPKGMQHVVHVLLGTLAKMAYLLKHVRKDTIHQQCKQHVLLVQLALNVLQKE